MIIIINTCACIFFQMSDVSELPPTSFAPDRCSTQKNTVDSTSKGKEALSPSLMDRTTLDESIVAATVTSTTTTNIDQTVGRSIPFEPYTLPSLKTETLDPDEVSTQPYVPVKCEPASQTLDDSVLDVTDCHQGKRTRRRAEQMDVSSEDDTQQWQGGKKQRLDAESTAAIKTERVRTDGNNHKQQRIKRECQDENLFDLPQSMARSKRQTSAQVSCQDRSHVCSNLVCF